MVRVLPSSGTNPANLAIVAPPGLAVACTTTTFPRIRSSRPAGWAALRAVIGWGGRTIVAGTHPRVGA